MSATSPTPDEPITAVCAATYYADLIPAYAFVFRVPSTRTRFTVYATDADRYRINETYTLAFTPVEGHPAATTGPAEWQRTGGGQTTSQPEGSPS